MPRLLSQEHSSQSFPFFRTALRKILLVFLLLIVNVRRTVKGHDMSVSIISDGSLNIPQSQCEDMWLGRLQSTVGRRVFQPLA